MKGIKGYLRLLDIFGHEVKLLYKGNSTKQTLLGSFMTVISTLIQLDLDNLLFPISKESFDTALVLIPPFAFSQAQDKYENIYRYVNITTTLTITTDKLDKDGDRISEDQNLELFQCSKDRMFSSDRFTSMIEKYEFAESLCYKQFEQLELRTDNNRISYQISSCDQDYLSKKYPNSTCEKNQTKAKEILMNTYLIIFSSSYYFDPEEFNQSPIKVNTVQNAFRFSQFEKIVNFEIGLNKAIISDSKLHENIGSFSREFISTKFVSQGANDKSLANPIHFTIQQVKFAIKIISRFYMTTEQNVFERQANNLVGALSNTGGLAGILFAVVRILIGPMQEFLYYQSLIEQSFMVENDRVLSEKREIFEFGKMKIEKQFDIAVILRDLRTFKMTNSLLLSKYQRKLIPFFKKYQLNQMYERNIQKQEKAMKQGEHKLFVNEVTQLMIELFSDHQNPSNSYNQVFLHSLFLQNRENAQKDLKTLMYKAVLRYFIQTNIDTLKLCKMSTPSEKSLISSEQKSSPKKRQATLVPSASDFDDIRLKLIINKTQNQLSTDEKYDADQNINPINSLRDVENQVNTEGNIYQRQNERSQSIEDLWEDAQVQDTHSQGIIQQIKR
ncbi:UNKNOWN [Stylonychia lemnae]|uniref:Uncharacterized protein n=1 Tax=Stylonychia lemnae TaxID=5949 RepID=A0A078AMS9_STYLE|nr:UNKNOWN [Stylonychia lemnae]|eukprot:CDW82682.1 UNKNOWN [Stylonychia lemnae]